MTNNYHVARDWSESYSSLIQITGHTMPESAFVRSGPMYDNTRSTTRHRDFIIADQTIYHCQCAPRKKSRCISLCKRLADVYHRAGQNNYKLLNISCSLRACRRRGGGGGGMMQLAGLFNCKAKGIASFFRLVVPAASRACLRKSILFFILRSLSFSSLSLSFLLCFHLVVLVLMNYDVRERERECRWPPR